MSNNMLALLEKIEDATKLAKLDKPFFHLGKIFVNCVNEDEDEDYLEFEIEVSETGRVHVNKTEDFYCAKEFIFDTEEELLRWYSYFQDDSEENRLKRFLHEPENVHLVKELWNEHEVENIIRSNYPEEVFEGLYLTDIINLTKSIEYSTDHEYVMIGGTKFASFDIDDLIRHINVEWLAAQLLEDKVTVSDLINRKVDCLVNFIKEARNWDQLREWWNTYVDAENLYGEILENDPDKVFAFFELKYILQMVKEGHYDQDHDWAVIHECPDAVESFNKDEILEHVELEALAKWLIVHAEAQQIHLPILS